MGALGDGLSQWRNRLPLYEGGEPVFYCPRTTLGRKGGWRTEQPEVKRKVPEEATDRSRCPSIRESI